jgi:predicted nucleotidyltransferase
MNKAKPKKQTLEQSLIKQKILDLESELVPLVREKLGKNLVSVLATGGCANFDAVPGWSDYDLIILVNDRKKVPVIDVSQLEKKYGISPIQIAAKPWRSFVARTKGSEKTDRYVDTLWLIAIRAYCRVLAGKKLVPLIPPLRSLLARDLHCELRCHYLHETNSDPDWNIVLAKNPKRWVNCVVSLSHMLLLAKGVFVPKNEIPSALEKYYPDFTGFNIVAEALKIRSTGKIPTPDSAQAKQAKKLLTEFLKIYREYLFQEYPAK